MELVRGLSSLRPRHRGTVATIGNFDGVHRGHLAVLQEVRRRAQQAGLPSTVILFEPMPQEYFAGAAAPLRLTRFIEKWAPLQAAGMDRLVCLKFGPALAGMEAEAFIDAVLVKGLGVKHLTVGDDFRFGRNRRGDFRMLAAAGAQAGFGVSDTASLEAGGERVSSTRIRTLLAQGNLRAAEALLGRPFSLMGRVMRGAALGRGLGFPTVNVALRRREPPVSGIFAARVRHRGGSQPAAAYIGKRPAVGGDRWVVEAHLLDYRGDLYGTRIEVQFLERLREDRHFDSLDALTVQMQQDVNAARAWLAEHPEKH